MAIEETKNALSGKWKLLRLSSSTFPGIIDTFSTIFDHEGQGEKMITEESVLVGNQRSLCCRWGRLWVCSTSTDNPVARKKDNYWVRIHWGGESFPDQEKGLVCDRMKDGSSILIEGRRWEHSKAGFWFAGRKMSKFPSLLFFFCFSELWYKIIL